MCVHNQCLPKVPKKTAIKMATKSRPSRVPQFGSNQPSTQGRWCKCAAFWTRPQMIRFRSRLHRPTQPACFVFPNHRGVSIHRCHYTPNVRRRQHDSWSEFNDKEVPLRAVQVFFGWDGHCHQYCSTLMVHTTMSSQSPLPSKPTPSRRRIAD